MRSLSHVCNVSDALDAQTDSLAALVRENGTEKVEAIIKIYLIQLNDLLNIKRPLTEIQIEETAIEIVSSFKLLTMADIHVIFRRARRGEYGEMYETINMPKIITWFRQYDDERVQAAMERNERETERYKSSYTGSDERTGKPILLKRAIKNQKPKTKN